MVATHASDSHDRDAVRKVALPDRVPAASLDDRRTGPSVPRGDLHFLHERERRTASATVNPDEVVSEERLTARAANAGPVTRCACGGTPGPSGECAACRARRLGRSTAVPPGDAIHGPIIEGFREEHGLPPGGADELGPIGPTDAEIKYASRNCSVATGPTYTPSGTIPVTTTGGQKSARFAMAATFATHTGNWSVPRCCEVRQYIKWDKRFHDNAGGPPHGGFPSGATHGTWYEDRDSSDTMRYGHRSGTYSFVGPNCGNEYKTGGARDMANGDTYCGRDAPTGPASDIGQYQFQLKVVDHCNADAVKASSSVITVPWG